MASKVIPDILRGIFSPVHLFGILVEGELVGYEFTEYAVSGMDISVYVDSPMPIVTDTGDMYTATLEVNLHLEEGRESKVEWNLHYYAGGEKKRVFEGEKTLEPHKAEALAALLLRKIARRSQELAKLFSS